MKLFLHKPLSTQISAQSVVKSKSREISDPLYTWFPESPEPSIWPLAAGEIPPAKMFEDGSIPSSADDQSLAAMFSFEAIPGSAQDCHIGSFLRQDSPVSEFMAASVYSPPQSSTFTDTTCAAESFPSERSDLFCFQPSLLQPTELNPLLTSTGLLDHCPDDQRSPKRRRLTKPAKSHKNKYERKRLHTITGGLDTLQGAVWKEEVTKKEERRKRATVLQRAAGYIRLLSAAADGNVSDDLLTCLQAYAGRSAQESDGIEDRTLMLRVLLEAHEVEIRQANNDSIAP